VVIIGAGFGGIAAAIELRRYGFTDVTILERGPGLGGTWRFNSYPGAACDVPSHLYSFSFAQRRDWSRLCSPQQEILEYLEGVAHEHDVDSLVQTGVEVTSCRWDEGSGTWTVSSADDRRWEADAVIIATGQLHQPSLPRIEGTFDGHSFHSSAWDHDYDLRGKRVAVIGTGATAVQFVPEIAPLVDRLDVFQRTGNWFLPRENKPYPRSVRWVIKHVPGVQDFRRRFIYEYGESLTLMIRHPRTFGRVGGVKSARFMRKQVPDLKLREKIWPDYTFGCKRVLFSSFFLETLGRPNVDLITEPIARLEGQRVITADGQEREVDCVIYGTGFRTNDFMFPMEISGAGGRSLREVWAGGAHAHNGICVPGFPSLFLMYGPNTNTSGGSIILYEEAQAAYIRQALALVRARAAAAIDVRPEVEAESAWTACDSWYRDQSGRIVANWPGYMREYEAAVRVLDPSEFRFVAIPDREPVAA
jgi:cation diffusion facilitator CzcD-associated flavoprotein CzcO